MSEQPVFWIVWFTECGGAECVEFRTPRALARWLMTRAQRRQWIPKHMEIKVSR